jgi:hypothetical protein
MQTDALGVVDVTAAGLQVDLVTVDRPRHGERLAAILIGILAAAGEDAGPILGLPEIKDVGPVRVLEVVGNSKRLGPVAASSIRRTDNPCACRLIAAVA